MSQREQILKEIGLGPVWKLRDAAPAAVATAYEAPAAEPAPVAPTPRVAEAVAPLNTPIATSLSTAAEIAQMDWPQLQNAANALQHSDIFKTSKPAALGAGDAKANWLFVAESPSADEDERAKLFDAMLAAINLKRGENVYIAHAVTSSLPNNRAPESNEITACQPYLARQIALIQPKVIVALGRLAAQALLQRDINLNEVRGQALAYQGVPLIVIYSPAYLLRNLHHKASAWEDLCLARKTMG